MGRPHHVYIGYDCKGAILAMFTLGMTINGHPCNVYFGYDLIFFILAMTVNGPSS